MIRENHRVALVTEDEPIYKSKHAYEIKQTHLTSLNRRKHVIYSFCKRKSI